LKGKWKPLLICLALPLAGGALVGWLTREGMERFAFLRHPPLTPPGWVFPVVWIILYTLMGVASWLVLRSGAPGRRIRVALTVYGAQLAVNLVWPVLFFGLGTYCLALGWLLALWALAIAAAVLFHRLSQTAGWLLVPYVVWLTFAAYLNFGAAFLN